MPEAEPGPPAKIDSLKERGGRVTVGRREGADDLEGRDEEDDDVEAVRCRCSSISAIRSREKIN
uniref:WRKY transcription factor 3 family protein n=1 Tax=Rhizophora mucronata TaxID=61149 RepID=A0A2P2IXM4_RHIMU